MTKIENNNAYIKTEWIDNVTIVDAKKLNKMEDALESIKESTESNTSKINKKFDSAIKEYNKLIFLSEGIKLSEVDLSSLISSGPMGPQGPQGPQGIAGVTPNIQIGEVTTLSPSSKATVTRRGTDIEPIFDFGIPKGEPGEEPVVDDELHDSVATNKENIDILTNNMNDITNNMNDLTNNMNTLTTNVNILTASVNDLVDDMNSIKQALDSDIAKIKANVDDMKSIL